MSPRFNAACALVLLSALPSEAHRLDEYLQATTIAVERERVQVEIRMAPGVAVFPAVFAGIDGNGDGVVSAAEERTYAKRVMADLSLTIDGRRLPLRFVSSWFAPRELLKEGRGEIEIRLEADVPGGAATRRLAFENRHWSTIGSYLVNGLVPRDPRIQLTAQQRSYDQSVYQLDYADAGAPAGGSSITSLTGQWEWIVGALMAISVGLALLHRRLA